MKVQARIIDEFAFILIGALVFFAIMIYTFHYVKFYPNITQNLTFSFPSFTLDTTKKFIEIFSEKDITIKKSLIKQNCLIIPIYFTSEEIKNIDKIKIDINGEKEKIEIFAIYGKEKVQTGFQIEKIYGLNSIEICPVYEVSIFFNIYLILIIFVFAISFFLYKEYKGLRNFAISFSLISTLILLILIGFEAKKESIAKIDEISIKALLILKASKEFSFYVSNITFKEAFLYFEVYDSIQNSNLKIYLNENLFFDSKVFAPIKIDIKDYIQAGTNKIKFEIEGEARYKLKNIKIIIKY